MEDQKNLTIEGNGSLFMMHGNMMALAVVHSENVELKNFAWDFAVPTVSEMTVQAVGEANGKKYVDYYIPACFPYQITGNTIRWTSELSPYTGEPYWTATGIHNSYGITVYQPEDEMSRIYHPNINPFSGVQSIEEREKGLVRITYTGNVPELAKPGHVIQLAGNARRETAGAFTWESKNVTADHINVHFMHGFGWLVQMSENVFYRNCNLMPREGSGHITTSFADGIHASGAKGQFVIENCNFANTHDDPINMHGTFTRVERRVDDHTLEMKYVHAQQGGFPQYHVGDKVQFFTRDTLESTDNEKQYTVAEVISNPGEDGYDLRTMKVRFAETLPTTLSEQLSGQPKYVAENVTYAPSVTIKGCTFKNVTTRSILCTTRNPVVIEDNVFYPSSMAAIFLSNDSNDWYESGPIRDMTIRNNIFYVDDIGGRTSWPCAPAIWVHPVTKGNGLPAASNPIHKNITVEGNTFFMDEDMVVKAESVENFRFTNNNIFRMNPDISIQIDAAASMNVGETLPLTVNATGNSNTKNIDNLFEFRKSKDVLISGNNYDDGMKNYIVAEDRDTEQTLTNNDSEVRLVHDRNQPASDQVSHIRYASSDPEVAYVDQNQNIVGKKAGTVQIVAYYEWNDTLVRSNTVEVTVGGEAAGDKLEILPADPSPVKAGETLKLSVKGNPADVQWKVTGFENGQSTNVATISSDGTLTAHENGIVWVSARTATGMAKVPVEVYGAAIQQKNNGFSITREDAAKYKLTQNAVEITMKTGDLYNDNNTVKNLVLYDDVNLTKNNLRTVVKMSGMPVREDGQWDTASFILYKNDDNYVTVGKKSHYNGFASVVEKNGAAVETGGDTKHNNTAEAYLGMTVKGSKITLDYKIGDGPWTQIRQITDHTIGNDYKIGMACWHTHDRQKKVTFSDFHVGSADKSYDELLAEEAISFIKTKNDRPQVSDVQVRSVNGDPTVSYTFTDADGDGRSLYLWSWMENGQEVTKVATAKNLNEAGVTEGFCRVYPVDVYGEPGAASAKVSFTAEQEDTLDLHSIVVNGEEVYQRGGEKNMTVTIPAEMGKMALQYASVNNTKGTTAVQLNDNAVEGSFSNTDAVTLTVKNGDTVKILRDNVAYTVTVRTIASNEAKIQSAAIPELDFSANVSADSKDAFVLTNSKSATLTVQASSEVKILKNEYRRELSVTQNGQSYTCPIDFANGINTFYVKATAADGKTVDTYRIHVICRPDNRVAVNSIHLNSEPLEGFTAEQKSYVYNLAAGQEALNVSVSAAPESDVSIILNNTAVKGTTADFTQFEDGANKLIIRAKAEDGITEAVYEITVVKPYDTNTALQSAVLNDKEISAKLSETTTELFVGSATATLKVAAQDARAKVSVHQGDKVLAEAVGQAEVTLTPYDNDKNFSVQITAADGTTVKAYPFSLTRSTYASDLNWTSATVGYGDSVHKDKNHNNTTITLADAAGKPVTFEKGLGTHAESIIKHNVEGKGFTAIDGYAGLDYGQYNAAYGSVQFQIFADDTNIFDSGVMRQKTPMQEIQVEIPAGTRQITLKVLMVEHNWNDHANWADLKFVGSFGEKPTADKTELLAAITTAQTKQEADYTVDSWAAFVQARDEAVVVSENADASQDEVDKALAKLNVAMEALKTKGEADQEAAAAVDARIDAIGQVTLDSEAAIDEARAAYEVLTETQKTLVTKLDVLEAAETTLQQLKDAAAQAEADKAAAAAVDTKITAIGEVKLESEAQIVAARAAYEALTETQKTLVTKLADLEAAEAKLKELKDAAAQDEIDKAAAKGVTDLIDAIGEVTLESESQITDARNAYDRLTEAQKTLVGDKLATLEAAETKLAELKEAAAQADREAAAAVDAKIDAIGTVTLESETKITEARAAYSALTDAQKVLVTKLAALEAAETKLAELKEAAAQADREAAAAVDAKIDAIGTVTLESETKITEARAAYSALTDAQKVLVTKLAALEAAETKLAELKEAAAQEEADRKAAAAVDAKIDAIGTVTLESETKITEARTAYNALTETQKKLVRQLNVLDAAENALTATKEKKADLDTAIQAAGEKKAADYTEDSWESFAEALATAKSVFAKNNVSMAEYEKAADELTAAMDKLVAKTVDPVKPVDPEKPAEPTTPAESDANSPTTGDDSGMMPWAAMAMLSAGAVALLKKKRAK